LRTAGFASEELAMLGLDKIGLNLRIGSKLAITSGIGVLLMAAIIVNQMIGNGQIKEANFNVMRNDTNALTAANSKASVRGMQIAGRDLRLAATLEDVKKAGDTLAIRHDATVKYADYLVQNVRAPVQQERARKNRALIEQYFEGAREFITIRSEVLALQAKSGGASSADAESKIAALNARYAQIVRDKMLPAAQQLEVVAQEMEDFAKARAEDAAVAIADEMTFVERLGLALASVAVLLLIGAAVFLFLSIARPVRALTGGMLQLADGKFDVVLPGLGRKDEIGEIAGAVETFKVKAAEKAAAEADEILRRQKTEAEAQAKAAQERAKLAEEQGRVVESLAEGLRSLSDGDLTFRLPEFPETYRQIRDDFNSTIAQLQDTIRAIATATREVANTAAEISTSTTDLSQRTEEQAAGLEETSASMEQISATVKKNAENAQQANAFAAGTREVADRGGQVVAQAVNAMARIEESSRKISDIISVIDEIARQTNLLALNAAVEAARAGEAGRGFAVVASEVRSLAQRSSQAAKDIKDLITNSSGQVQEGVELVNKAGASLTEIVESIKKVAEIVSEIAAASAEQSTGIDQVNTALTQMDEVTQQNSALVEENAASAKSLEQQSQTMDQRVSFFRVDDAHAVTAPKRPAAPPPRVVASNPPPRPAAAKQPAPAVRRAGGRAQAAAAVAPRQDQDWKEF
jgi:methyl-accepting chemotaxis protein